MAKDKFIKTKIELAEVIGVKKTKLYKTLKEDETFPKPNKLGHYNRAEVEAWLKTPVDDQGSKPSPVASESVEASTYHGHTPYRLHFLPSVPTVA